MGKAFFTGWVLWQQMTFVLGCGIVATILIGLAKLRYDQLRIRKYSKVDKGKQPEAPTPDMIEAQRRPRTEKDVPFGIRAIESGIEVDGVWISRSNTPVGSSRSSITEVKLNLGYTGSQLELPATFAGSSRNSSRAASTFDLAVNAERLNTAGSRASSPGRSAAAAHKCCHCGHSTSRNSTALHALEGSPSSSASSAHRQTFVEQQPSASTSRESSGKSSRRTSDESDYLAVNGARPFEPAYVKPRHTVVSMAVDPRTDLDLLQTHRLSHVAETGQLMPRVRRPGQSGDWASVADQLRSPEEIAQLNGIDYFVPQQKTPSPPPAAAGPSSRKSMLPAPTTTTSPSQETLAANQSRQAVPLLESYAARPYYLPESYQPRGPHHEYSYEEMPIEVSTSQNQRESQVLRKVNSGFEILRPGTLQPPSPEEEDKMSKDAKRQSRRLQKKRTSSVGSRTSHFVEQV